MVSLRKFISARTLRKVGAISAMLGGVVVLMLYLYGVFHPKVGDWPGQPSGRPVGKRTVVEVAPRSIPAVEAAPGSIWPVAESFVASKILEKVVEINVQAGQEVAKGDVLVRLDEKLSKTRMQQAQAAAQAAEAVMADAGLRKERIEKAFARGAATQAELDTTRNAFSAATARAELARRRLEEAKIQLGYTVIRSPADGVVTDRRVNVGDTVSTGQVLLSVYDQMQLVAHVREGALGRLRVGQEVDVRIDALDATCRGTVSEIVPQADPSTRTFPVKVRGPCKAGVRKGAFGRLLIPLADERLLLLPAAAVEHVGQLTMVDTVQEGWLFRRAVRLGRTLTLPDSAGTPTEYAEVLSGLVAGERVALPPAGASRHD